MIAAIKKRVAENVSDTPGIFRKVILSWLLAAALEYLLLPQPLRSLAGLEGLAQMSFLRVLAVTGVIAAVLLFVPRLKQIQQAERWGMVGSFALLAVLALWASFTWAFLAVCLLVLAIVIVFAFFGWNDRSEPKVAPQKAHWAFGWITAALATGFCVFLTVWTVGRIYCFFTPTYDFGIFSQMFHNMKETGLPMTTLERDGLLSHFDVHVSPIYYLMLPFYCLFPNPITLQVLQAVVMTSAVIPLWLIGKNRGLSGLQRMLLCAVLLFWPAFAGGVNYDLHENCFLTPLLLWLFYGIEKKNTAVTAVSALLTLMVKEDAAVYVAVIGLWLLVKALLGKEKKDVWELVSGVMMIAGALGWFLAVTGYLASNGDGVMTYRYDNFIYDGSASLTAVVKAVIINPMKAVYECVDPEKLQYIYLTLLPLLGLPLLSRRYERYILLIPYVLVNLMSDYQYQHSILFQYNFGSGAFLIYLATVNAAELKFPKFRVAALAAAAMMGAVCFWQNIYPVAEICPKQAVHFRGYYQSIRDALAEIPDDVSVSATTFYTTTLSNRAVLYDVRYTSLAHILETEYVVLQKNLTRDYENFNFAGSGKGFDNLVAILEHNGYSVYSELGDILVIYHKNP